ncbi:thioesterase family protein [Sinorhizobium americanum]|uniref:Acyl-CoA thioester hydrolase n=1 Tax=Sinorhizobium americanum TaxID=194963 RepID=A0A4R2B4W4_9HYPH|nr:thioesterase family protein [Sinorhizobium americanum]TCN20369.1 acyl-CoA thioester hydrolase [Sinorhizobium americanum]
MFVSSIMEIEKDWIDYNGHLNMAYYHVLFNRAGDDAFDEIGIGAAYTNTHFLTSYSAEVHVCYVRELHFGQRVSATFRLLDYDEKRMHYYQELRHVDGWLAATSEQLCLHIDMSGPKVVPFPPDILSKLERVLANHAKHGVPVRAGRKISIKRKPNE